MTYVISEQQSITAGGFLPLVGHGKFPSDWINSNNVAWRKQATLFVQYQSYDGKLSLPPRQKA